MTPRPCLRPEIDAVPTEQEDELLFILHDRSGLSGAQLAVSPVVMFVASLFDGANSILDIQDRFRRETQGGSISVEQIEDVLKALDECLFLKGPRFDDHFEQSRREFMETPVREARSSGSAYSNSPEELHAELDEYISSAPTPEETVASGKLTHPPRGVIAPHIDYARGGPAYGQVYRELAAREAPDTVVIIGTAHYPMRSRFSVLAKDFAVPGGRLRVNTDLAQQLSGSRDVSFADPADLFAHRGEHSIELQAVWLHHIWGEQVRIVPVLAGSMHEFFDGTAPIEDDSQFRLFAELIRQPLSGSNSIMILASADLAHIGPRFGDEREISDEFLAEVEDADRTYLSAIASGDADAGYSAIRHHHDQYHVCGTGCIYALGLALPGIKGRLLGYHQAATPEMQQAVTFAGMLFE